MLLHFFVKIYIWMSIEFNRGVYFLKDKDHGKCYLLCLFLYILKFALERQLNVESNSTLVTFQFRGMYV